VPCSVKWQLKVELNPASIAPVNKTSYVAALSSKSGWQSNRPPSGGQLKFRVVSGLGLPWGRVDCRLNHKSTYNVSPALQS